MKRDKLEGKTFNQLTVKEYIGNGKYLCLCECGKQCEVYGYNLKTGHTKSCGCVYTVDITGKIFGNLKVLKRGEPKMRGKYKRTTWDCECLLCGNITNVYHDSLISKTTTSCGCLFINKDMPKEITDSYVNGTQLTKLCMTPTKANKSGVVGVNWDKSRGKWQVGIRFKGHRYNLGRYDDFDLACQVRKQAEKEVHGEFLKWYEEIKVNSKNENK